MTIKNIVFDFGGVLVDWNPRYLYEQLFDNKHDMEYFLTHICTEAWNIEQDAGRTLADGTRLLQEQFPEHHDMIQRFYDDWEVMVKGDIPQNTSLLRRLNEKGYRLFGLTNWSGETFPIALKRFPFFQEFEGIVVSGDEKMIKPDERIYRLLLDRYQLRAEECVFIDDNINNISAANVIGFHTIHFANGLNLEQRLLEMEFL